LTPEWPGKEIGNRRSWSNWPGQLLMANYLELTFFQCICCRCCAYESKKPKTKPNISWHISHWRHTKNAHKFYLAKFQRVSPAKWQPKEVKRSAKSDNNNKLRALLECTMQVAIVCHSLAIPNPPIYPFSPPFQARPWL